MRANDIADVYPLSPLQEGLLFHSVSDSSAHLYCEQVTGTVGRPTDLKAFIRAWERLVEREAVLRTAFVWQQVDEPLQVVRTAVQLPLKLDHWGELSPDEERERWERLVQEERMQGFNLSQAPLFRLRICELNGYCRFSFCFHHLLLDGWSLGLLFSDLSQAYQLVLQGREPDLPPRPPYRRFIAWQKSQKVAASERFWRAYLHGFQARTGLAPDHSVASIGTMEVFAEHALQLSESTTAGLRQATKRHGLTLNTLVQGAWALLLSRYVGADDVVFGVTTAGRSVEIPDVDAIIGLFLNTLPLRTRVPASRSLREWLTQLQSAQSKLINYQHTPLAHIQRCGELSAGQSLFETVLIFENYPPGSVFGAEQASPVSAEIRSLQLTNYPFHLMVTARRKLDLHVTFDHRTFSESWVAQCLRHLARLLEEMPLDMDRPVGLVPMLESSAERYLVELGSGASAERRGTVLEAWTAAVEETPDSVAIVAGQDRLTIRQVDEQAGKLSRMLLTNGGGPEQIIGIIADRNAVFWIAVLAVLKTGAAFLPIDPAQPVVRVEQALSASKCDLLLLGETMVPTFQAVAWGGRRWVIEQELTRVASEIPAPALALPAECLAYVIFTSGSSGMPKGVMIPHRSMLNHLRAKIETLCIGPADVVGQTAPQHFDISVWQFFAPVIAGASVCVILDDIAKNASLLLDEIERAGITIVELVPSILRTVVNEATRLGPARPGLARLRILMVTGEVFPSSLCREWLMHYPQTRVLNAYGPTECGDDVTQYMVDGLLPKTSVPIGSPLPNIRLHVLGKDGQSQPAGVVGELYVGGPSVGRGYVNDPIRTAEAFVPDPFSTLPGMRLYRTGDRVRYLPSGELEFVGRADDQVKLRGHRVELGEIEFVLLQQPDIAQAAVKLCQGNSERQFLTAYLVPQPGRSIDSLKVLSDLRQRLPEQLVPSVVLQLEHLPRLPNGKLDRNSLVTPALALAPLQEDLPEPTHLESRLQEIWMSVLGLPRVGLHDNFFALGGDSIVSLQVVARAKRAGIDITNRQMFEHQTIAALAAVATNRNGSSPRPILVENAPPLTPSQRWFFEQTPIEPHHWNISIFLEITHGVDLRLLERALEHVVEHHEALRLRFSQRPDGANQTVMNAGASGLVSKFVVARRDPAARVSELQKIAAQFQKSLSLEAGPLVRMAFFDLGPDLPGKALLTIHHLAVDGLSLRILYDDLQEAYHQLERGMPVALPAVEVSFTRYAWWLEEHARSDVVRRELQYWRKVVHKPCRRIPPDHKRGSNSLESTRVVMESLSHLETHTLLHTTFAMRGIFVEEILVAAITSALATWIGPGSFLLDLEGHGRHAGGGDELDLSRTVGWLSTLYPLRLDVARGLSAEELLLSVVVAMRSVPRRGLGYGLLRYGPAQAGNDAGLGKQNEREIRFNYLGQFDQLTGRGDTFAPIAGVIGSHRGDKGDRRYILEIDAYVLRGQLWFVGQYSENIHTEATILEFFRSILEALRLFAGSSGVAPVTLPPATAEVLASPQREPGRTE